MSDGQCLTNAISDGHILREDEGIEVAQQLKREDYDVVIIGAGASGIAAAIESAELGLKTVVIDAGPAVGGELISGLPIDGCLNSRGEWIVGGVARALFDACDKVGGYIGPLFDWRTLWAVCLDPELFKLAISDLLVRAGVTLRLYTMAEDVVMDRGAVHGVVTVSKSGRSLITGRVFLDCSGDGDLAVLAGAPFEKGDSQGRLQSVSLVFRICGVNYRKYVEFVRDNPDEFVLAENPVIDRTRPECAIEVYKAGMPFAAISAEGKLLSSAISDQRMYPCSAVFVWPTSTARKEVGLNTTRLAGVDATEANQMSNALTTLSGQIKISADFVRDYVPGFEDAELSAIAPRVGVRETRRIVGETALRTDDVRNARKRSDGIAKGAHHIDIHGAGTEQIRIPIANGGSYDIPYGALIPKTLTNVLVGGRCISSEREANGSSRVMGTCMATSQAAATAAKLFISGGHNDTRDIPVESVRALLRERGAVLDGTA